MSRRALSWVAALGLAVLGVALWQCRPAPPRTPEEQIRALLDQAARSAAARRPDEVVALLAPGFVAEGGEARLTRDDVRRLLAVELLRGGWVSVSIASASVEVEGPRARARVDAVLARAAGAGKALAERLPGDATAHRFELTLAQGEDGAWRVIAGSWRRIGLDEVLAGPEPAGASP